MAVRRSQTWTVSGDREQIAAIVGDFLRRRSFQTASSKRRGSDQRLQLRRGSRERARERGARLTSEDDLPLKGTIELTPGQRGQVRVLATFEADRGGLILGRGPMRAGSRRRFEQLFSELVNDLGQALGDMP